MEISKEQVLKLYDKSFHVDQKLKEWFPEAFKFELKVGKVYKFIGTNKSIIKILDLKDNSKCYGFTNSGDYFTQGIEAKSMSYCYADKYDINQYLEATTEEWESALIEEAKKRGYKNGNYKCLAVPNKTYKNIETDIFSIYENCVWFGNGAFRNKVFKEGVWSEIIKTFSKEEAEKLLGGKII